MNVMTKRTKIKPLTLVQDGVAADFGTTTETWYGVWTPEGIDWGRSTYNLRAGRACEYECDVTLPAITFCTENDRRRDTAVALWRHAQRLGLND